MLDLGSFDGDSLMLHQQQELSLTCAAVDVVQTSWRRWGIWRGRKTPSCLYPVRTTWSWPSCCSTSRSPLPREWISHFPTVCLTLMVCWESVVTQRCHLVNTMLIDYWVREIKNLELPGLFLTLSLPLLLSLSVSAVLQTTSRKLMKSARWSKTSGTPALPNCACQPTASSLRWKLTPRFHSSLANIPGADILLLTHGWKQGRRWVCSLKVLFPWLHVCNWNSSLRAGGACWSFIVTTFPEGFWQFREAEVKDISVGIRFNSAPLWSSNTGYESLKSHQSQNGSSGELKVDSILTLAGCFRQRLQQRAS